MSSPEKCNLAGTMGYAVREESAMPFHGTAAYTEWHGTDG